MIGWIMTLILYYGIAAFFFCGIGIGRLKFTVISKDTNEELDEDTALWKLLAFSFCMGWPILVIKTMIRRYKDEFSDRNS